MAWETSDRLSRLPENWQQLRIQTLRRDDYRCRWRIGGGLCGARANQVDHIHRGDDHSPENLQSLCEEHHAIKSSREGGQAKAARIRASKLRVERPQETHPVIPATTKPKYKGF